MIEFDINIIGPKAQMSLPDLMRYEPGFSLDLMMDLAFPVGEYDNTKTLNLGQNRWYGRIGAPISLANWSLGPRQTYNSGILAGSLAFWRQH